MKYNLFLFDLDDTLLDFQASEKLCFQETFLHFNINMPFEDLYQTYKVENALLWKQIEKGEIDKDFLKVERFKRTLSQHGLQVQPEIIADYYLEQLPNHVVLIDGAVEVCTYLKQHGQIGIITNGIGFVQRERIKISKLSTIIDFIAVSEDCGFAKPDTRFFEFAANQASNFKKDTALIIGDRLEADILGGNNFGIDSCWFNPNKLENISEIIPKFTINHLLELKGLINV